MAFAADDRPLPRVGSPHVVAVDERRSTMDNYGRTSRRGFVALGVTIVGSLVVPSSAYGKSNGLGTVEVPGSETAREKWAIAPKKAEQEGSPVISAYTSSGGEAMPSDVLTASSSVSSFSPCHSWRSTPLGHTWPFAWPSRGQEPTLTSLLARSGYVNSSSPLIPILARRQ